MFSPEAFPTSLSHPAAASQLAIPGQDKQSYPGCEARTLSSGDVEMIKMAEASDFEDIENRNAFVREYNLLSSEVRIHHLSSQPHYRSLPLLVPLLPFATPRRAR
jgi:hypothetical protein